MHPIRLTTVPCQHFLIYFIFPICLRYFYFFFGSFEIFLLFFLGSFEIFLLFDYPLSPSTPHCFDGVLFPRKVPCGLWRYTLLLLHTNLYPLQRLFAFPLRRPILSMEVSLPIHLLRSQLNHASGNDASTTLPSPLSCMPILRTIFSHHEYSPHPCIYPIYTCRFPHLCHPIHPPRLLRCMAR